MRKRVKKGTSKTTTQKALRQSILVPLKDAREHRSSDNRFAEAKDRFDEQIKGQSRLKQSPVTVDGKTLYDIPIRNEKGERLEEYYKWQFISAMIDSGLCFKDYIGAEVWFPKGTPGAQPIKIDMCIFDSKDWLSKYLVYRSTGDREALDYLRKHCVAVVDFKRKEEDREKVFTEQLRAYMREPDSQYILGAIYEAERLFLFQNVNGDIRRYDDAKQNNQKPKAYERYSLHLADAYSLIPSHDELLAHINRPTLVNRSSRTIADLGVVTRIASVQVTDALNHILRTLDKYSLIDERGYRILIQTLALKIFDEKTNERFPDKLLQFYIEEDEKIFRTLNEQPIQDFIRRLEGIWAEAETRYSKILKEKFINFKSANHVRAVVSIVEAFQDYSFVRSADTDLYQLVFYSFAGEFKKQEKAQFLTPLELIRFLVQIVNPRGPDTVLDPCVGIADFLSLAYVHSNPKLDDNNLWGVDNDDSMIMLATLNMLLNGDGRAHLLFAPDKGSINQKIDRSGGLVTLIPELHRGGKWDNWKDETSLMKYSVVLTNPPFGKGRSYQIKNPQDREVIELYDLWNRYCGLPSTTEETNMEAEAESGESDRKPSKQTAIDLGVIFLENAYRMLDENGRLGIVLSNSIAAIDAWKFVRDWLTKRMRIVAIFDLPPNVFAEVDVKTTLVVAYKPSKEELERLIADNYQVFPKNITRIGYVKSSVKRNTVFLPQWKLDPNTFEVVVDKKGENVKDEEFSQVVQEFRNWAKSQEETLYRLFVGEN
jgi:type I restriction enzyme M protein